MNFRNILHEIEKTDPEVYDKLSERRHVLKSFGTKVAIAALPFAIGSMFSKKAYGKTTDAISDALNQVLQMKYLQYNLYHSANSTGGLIPAADKAGFQTIEAQEKAQINFLKTTLTAMGGNLYTPNHYNDVTSDPPYVPAGYDFTAGGTYPVYTSYMAFLNVAQAFEDLGVRAINGQMQNFIGSDQLTQMLQLLSTEGRHAAHVRFIRRFANAPEGPAPWITNNIPPVISLQNFYNGEENTNQRGIAIDGLPGATTGTVPTISATAAFDEPIDALTIKSLIAPFIKL